MPKPARPDRSAYRVFRPLATRWIDDDAYGHVNNVVYYSFFDTAVNGWLIERGLLERGEGGGPIGLVVRTECDYFAPVAFPQALQAGVAVEHLGTSSVRYRVGIFAEGEDAASAAGLFTHVYVSPQERAAQPLPARWREALGEIAA